MRADVLLVQQGLAASRTMAQRLILAGCVVGPSGVISKSALELPVGTLLAVTAEAGKR